ncbi:MAG: carboxylesterase family protein [Marinilabiliaceae bacterium]|nr:carboxylesterase family protein [Marinilabiliaceae bacterium]
MQKVFISLALLAMTMVGCQQTTQVNNPVLTIEGGDIQGVITETPGVYAYKGIPYAAAPLGDLRWKAPQPVTPWEGTRIADQYGHPSYQSVHYPGGYTTEWGYGAESPYSEDCLYLNVWTKAPGDINKKLPVALWIHGGGFREGWGTEPEFEGQEWANKDVVLVTINYRLGVFGFLNHPELMAENPDNVSGNYGILDQIESLKWIKKNIAQFGGDPDNVTIFGQSAGAGSVRFICTSPLASGLFHKAVIMSGGGLSTPTQSSRPYKMLSLEDVAKRNKEILDWAGISSLQDMRRASTEVLHTVSDIYGRATKQPFGGIFYSPVVDGKVIPENFDDAAIHNTLANVPYMIGYTLDDLGQMGEGIANFCYNRDSIGSPAWAYQFARPLPDDGSHPEVTARLKGAFHSSDLWFVFKTLKYCWRPWTKGDWDLSEKMLTYWTNFVKYSNPNGQDGTGAWTPCTKASPDFMIFKLDEKDNEASSMGTPMVGEPQSFPGMPTPVKK